MSSIVCQGLQSCLEPTFLSNKLTPSRSNLWNSSPPNEDDGKNRGKDENLGGWSFIQALTHMSQTPKEIKETEKIYIHPMTTKNSSSILSKKSLEMCTESLGSESGSDIGESIEELSSNLLQNRSFPVIQRSKLLEKKKYVIKRGNFPPPLSSITGSESVQVWPHREGGRLLIKAVTVNSNNGHFHTERRDGRLRLYLFKEDYEDEDEDEDEEENEEEMGINEGGESGIGEISRLSRCKEGGNEMKKWEPFLVAIS